MVFDLFAQITEFTDTTLTDKTFTSVVKSKTWHTYSHTPTNTLTHMHIPKKTNIHNPFDTSWVTHVQHVHNFL